LIQNNINYQFDKENGVQRTAESERGIQREFIESGKMQLNIGKEEFLHQQ
jgi:hypothetical protein